VLLRERVMRCFCVVCGADYEILARCEAIDRMSVAASSIQLLLVGGTAVSAWSIFIAGFEPLTIAIPAGTLIASLVFFLDRAMCASDWSLSGVLQNGPPPAGWWGRLGFRLVVALVLALSTASGIQLVLSGSAIDEQLRHNRALRNQPLLQEYRQAQNNVVAKATDSIERQLASLQAERERLAHAFEQRDKALSDARQVASRERVEAARENEGGLPGYVPGKGPRYRDASRLEEEAARSAGELTADARQLQARFDALDPAIDAKVAELARATAAARAEVAQLEAKMKADPRWYPEDNGPLSRWMALTQLESDPEKGPTVTWFGHLAQATLITLELSFLLCKMAFAPASLYILRLRLRTRQAALREIEAHREFVRVLRSGGAGRRPPTMRLVVPDRADPEAACPTGESG